MPRSPAWPDPGDPGFDGRCTGSCQSVFDRWQRQRTALGLPVFDPTQTYHGRAVPDGEIGMEVDCRSVAERVVAGILETEASCT